jgi:ABC-type glycerol-3-phosphate transport system permease component
MSQRRSSVVLRRGGRDQAVLARPLARAIPILGWLAPPRLTRRQLRHYITYAVLTIVCLIWVYPILWMFSSSLKTLGEFFSGLGLVPTHPDFDNYALAWQQANIGPAFLNSVIVSISGVLIVLFISSTMGYVLGRYSFPGRTLVFAALGALVFIPQTYTIIPIFDLITKMHLDGNLMGIILAESGSAHVIIILLFAGYFAQLPREIEEAAICDGAGFVRIFVSIMLPLAKPVIATAIILQFIASWNDFLIPLVLTLAQPALRTVAVGVYFLQGVNEVNWPELSAASSIALLPVILVFLMLQRYFVEGMSAAVKQ